MTTRLSRGEFWLLTSAATHRLPLPLLAMPEWVPGGSMDTIDIALNKQGHGLELVPLAQTLLRMARHGWIEFQRLFCHEERIHPDGDEMTHLLRERGDFSKTAYYGLTPAGGAIWESFARPDWNRYIDHSSRVDDDTGTADIIAADRKLIEKYLAALAHEETIEEGTIIVSELRPWQVTYWKSLPLGFHCTLRAKQRIFDAPPSTQRLRDRWCEWR